MRMSIGHGSRMTDGALTGRDIPGDDGNGVLP